MLYLMKPGPQMQWSDMPGRAAELAAATSTDLSEVDWWKPADRSYGDQELRVALRYGVAVKAGLIVDAGGVSVVRHADEIRAAHRASWEARADAEPTYQVADRIREAMGEVNAEQNRRDLDARVDASTAAAIADAEVSAFELLQEPPKEDLIEHWRRLGGTVPEPI
jgi:hypothetical protein